MKFKFNRYLFVLFFFLCPFLWAEPSSETFKKAEDMIEENKNYLEKKKQDEQFDMLKNQAKKNRIRKMGQFELDSLDSKDLPQFYISKIVLLGDFLGSPEIKKILDEANGTMVNIVDVQNLVKKLTNYYIKLGYFTTRVQLKVGQDISKGKLILSVFSGEIEGFHYQDSLWWCRTQIFMVYPFSMGKRPNISRVDAGLEVLNRLPSNNFVMKVIPEDSLGWSKVLLDNRKADVFRLDYSIDDKGSENTGKYMHSLSLGLDNALFLSDNWNYSYSENIGNKQARYKKSHSISNSIPFGTFMFLGSYNYSNYLMTIEGESLDYQTSGNSQVQNYGVKKSLYRSKFRKLNLEGNLVVSDEENFLEDTKLLTSSFRSSSISTNLVYNDLIFGGSFNSTLSYHRGVDWFGAREDTSGVGKNEPKAEFEKYKLSLFYSKAIKYGINVSLFANGQYTDMCLYGGEEFSGGGVSDVKGFSLRSSVSYSYRQLLYKYRWLPAISPSFSVDYGHVQSRTNRVKEDGAIMNLSLGLNWNIISFNADYQNPIFLPSGGDLTDYCTFGLSFSLNDFYHLGKRVILKKRKEPESFKFAETKEMQLLPLTVNLGEDQLDVCSDDSGKYIVVADQESLALYAKFLDIDLKKLLKINERNLGNDIIYCSQKLYLPAKSNFKMFVQRRIDFLMEKERKFWEKRKLVRLISYTIKNEAQLWKLAKDDFNLPFWLLKRYNRDLDFKNIEKGQKIVVPIVELR